jgi:hypothetical protein
MVWRPCTQLVPSEFIADELLEGIQKHIYSVFETIMGNEIVVSSLDNVGKGLLQQPFRNGGQGFQDIAVERDIAFTSTIASLSCDILEALTTIALKLL